MKNKGPYIHRDISWLAFNYRVLQEAKDQNVPLLERIKFLAIYSSNLDEFFRVRVANHKYLVRAGKKTFKDLEFSPKLILSEIMSIVDEQQREFSDIFQNQIIPELKKEKINILKRKKLNQHQKNFTETYFHDYILPHIQPVLLRGKKIKPFLMNSALYLALYMKNKDEEDKEKYYAIVKIPSETLGRFIIIPTEGKSKDIIIIDDIVRNHVEAIFPGYIIEGTYSIKLTRDAELYIDDEYSGDLIEKIRKSLNKRNVGTISRLIYDREMPSHLIDYLKDVFDLTKLDLLEEGRYHNNSDFFKFPSFGFHHLKDIPLPPVEYSALERSFNIFDSIDQQDHLLYYPFHSYQSVITFFEQASTDPRVTHIKIFQYRVAKTSKIMNALMNATKNGKQVTVFIEVKARFDERNNLKWGEKLEDAGVNVIYSFPGVKVHAKMALVRRVVNGEESFYTYLSSGNFNENTATLYSDFGLFTSDKKIIDETLNVFNLIETKTAPDNSFKYLGIGTVNLKQKLVALVKSEMEHAKQGKEAYITLKMNSLQDEEMIHLLYEASQCGVKVKLIVRGICSLVAGIKGMSENIEAISIVDRFLEHARVFIFGNNGNELIYIASSDWMVRNLHHRIETMFPILDEELKNFVRIIIRIQLEDNVKARLLDFKKLNKYKRNKGLPVRSQFDIYYYIKRREENNK